VAIPSSGTASVSADGYAPVKLTCNLTVQCRGSVVLRLSRPGFNDQGHVAGRSDVEVPAGATTQIDVPLDATSLSWLQSHGPTDLTVIVEAGLSFGCDGNAWGPNAQTTMGLPPCGTGQGAPVIHGFDLLSTGELTVAGPE
jgi:hypothetical protein